MITVSTIFSVSSLNFLFAQSTRAQIQKAARAITNVKIVDTNNITSSVEEICIAMFYSVRRDIRVVIPNEITNAVITSMSI